MREFFKSDFGKSVFGLIVMAIAFWIPFAGTIVWLCGAGIFAIFCSKPYVVKMVENAKAYLDDLKAKLNFLAIFNKKTEE